MFGNDSAPVKSIGAKLKEAREIKRLSIQQAAKELHFKPHLLTALEADDYTGTHSEVFARGYLKAYARLLTLPVDEILQDFDQLALASTIKHHKPEFIEQETYAIKTRSFRWFSYVLVVILIGLIVWWWSSHTDENKLISNVPAGDRIDQIKGKPAPQTLPIQPLSSATGIINYQSSKRSMNPPTKEAGDD